MESTATAPIAPDVPLPSAAPPAGAAPAPLPSLDRSLLRGIAWTGGIKWGCQILTWLATLVVARLLAPGDYGLVGMATMYMGLVTLLTEFGIGVTIVSLRRLSQHQIRQLNSFAVLFGLAGFLVSCAAAVPLSAFFHAPKLVPVLILMSSTFLISSFRTVPYAMLQKSLRFRSLALYEGLQSVLVSAATIALAWFGFGYWALVLGMVLGALFSTGLVLVVAPFPFSVPRVQAIREALTFSGHLLGGRISWYVYSNADFLVLGRVLGEQALGVYSLAWTIAGVAIEKVSVMVLRVTPAIFSAVQDDMTAMRRYFLLLTEGIALFTVPMTLGLALVADDFVNLVLGPKWTDAVLPLQLLSVYATVRSISPLLSQVLNMTGHVRLTMWNNVAAAVVFPVGFLIASRGGPAGVSAAWIVLHPVVLYPLYRRLFAVTGLTAAEYFRSLVPALQGSAAMAACVLLVHLIPPPAALPMLKVAAEVALGGTAYVATLFLLQRERIRATLAVLRR